MIIIAIIVILFAIVIANIAVVQQSQAYVIERLGAFQAIWGVGLHFKIPFIEEKAVEVEPPLFAGIRNSENFKFFLI